MIVLHPGKIRSQIHSLVGDTIHVAQDGIRSPDPARTLLPDTVSCCACRLAELRTGALRKAVLHLVRRELGVVTQHQGSKTGDDSRRHGCTRHLEVAPVNPPIGVRVAQVRVRPHERDNVGAGGNDIGLDKGIQCRASSGELRDVIIAEVVRGTMVGESPDGDDIGRVAWHPDAHGLWTRVANTGDHNDTGVPGCHHSKVVGVRPVRRDRGSIHRDIQNTDVIVVLMLNNPVDALEHVGIGASAKLIKHTDRHEIGGRGDAAILTVLLLVMSVPDDAGDVSAVTVRIAGGLERRVAFV